MAGYILREDGGKILLETSGAILLEFVTSLDANFWLPTFPDRIPPRKWPHQEMWQEFAALVVPVTIPIPDVLHTQWFLPHVEDRILPRKISHEVTEPTSAALFNLNALQTVTWLPTFPDHPDVRHATPVREGVVDATPSFTDVVQAATLAWGPVFPDHAITHLSRRQDPLAYAVFPPFIAAKVVCFQLGLEKVRSTTLTPEAAATTDLITQGLASTGLIAETLC